MAGPRLYWLAPGAKPPAQPVLNTAEQARLKRMTRPERAREYTVSRALLRQALIAETGVSASDAIPATGPLVLPPATGRFAALSHSQGGVLCALSHTPVGTDLEPRARRPDWATVSRRWFTLTESAHLAALPENRARDQFLLLWTLKEAWLKATHQGIAGNLQQLQLDPAREPGDWQLSIPGADYSADQGWHAAAAAHDGFWLTVVWQGHEAPTLQGKTLPWSLLTPLRGRGDS